MKDLKIYIAIASALLIIYMVVEYNKPNPINWNPTLYLNDKIPYGTFITYHQLNDIFPGSTIVRTNASIYNTLHDSTSVVLIDTLNKASRDSAVITDSTLVDSAKKQVRDTVSIARLLATDSTKTDSAKNVKHDSTYVAANDSAAIAGSYLIIAKNTNINKYDFAALLKYIKAGNSVFISSFAFSGFLADTLKLYGAYESTKGNSGLNFTNSRLKNPGFYKFKRDISNYYFSSFDTAKAVVLGKNDHGHSTFLSFRFGKGNLYLCGNPGVFTNYNLVTANGAEYAAKALSYLPATKNVYWDEFQNGDIPPEESPLRVFFDNPSLQWAYYISLFGLIIFVLYEIKRRQRIIPVIEPLQNATLEFVNVVGQVYYEKRNNTNIAHKKIIYLLTKLREEYQIKSNNLDGELVERMTVKLGIDAALARDLVNCIKQIGVKGIVSDRELIELNKLIEKLYTQIA